MAITKFTPQQVPFQASDNLRAFLDDQMQSIAPLLNNAAQRNEDEVIEGDWTFSGGLVIPQSAVTDHQAALALAASQITSGTFANARIAQGNVTQHQAALTILETQITDGSLLARVAANETISGNWTFTGNPVLINGGLLRVYTNVDNSDIFHLRNNFTTADVYFRWVSSNLHLYTEASGNGSHIMALTAAGNIVLYNDLTLSATAPSLHLSNNTLRIRDSAGAVAFALLDGGDAMYIRRRTAAASDSTGFGQIWVRSSDDALMYTSDSGVDRVVQTA